MPMRKINSVPMNLMMSIIISMTRSSSDKTPTRYAVIMIMTTELLR